MTWPPTWACPSGWSASTPRATRSRPSATGGRPGVPGDRPRPRGRGRGVKQGSAYDLHLGRTLRAAELVRGAEGTAVTEEQSLEVAAGIRTPVTRWATDRGWRVVEPAFMAIRQAVAVAGARRDTVPELTAWIERRKADGLIADALRRSGRTDARVAPPGG